MVKPLVAKLSSREQAYESWSDCLLEQKSDEALIALLLGPVGSISVLLTAQRMLEDAGGLEGLAQLTPLAIAAQHGVGRMPATRLLAAFELGQRRWRSRATGMRFDSLESVVAWARPRLIGLEHEEVWMLALDARNALRSCRRIGQGGQQSCVLTARDVLRPALRDGASAIILVHNHPSGDPTPSGADIEMTAQLDVACAAIGLTLLDHVVVSLDGATSLLDLGVVQAR